MAWFVLMFVMRIRVCCRAADATNCQQNKAMKTNLFVKGKAILLMASIFNLSPHLLAADTPAPAETPLVEILATDPTALEGTSSGAFTVLRSAASEADLVVSYAIAGTAANGVDYVLIKDQVTIPAKYMAVDVLIQPIADSINRGNKTVLLTLQTNAAYRLQEHQRATVTLVDDLFNNQAPTVALTAPADGALFKLPCVVTLEATASDADDAVQRVSFYADDRYLGRATNSPFTLSWTNPPAGTYALFARAVDVVGKSTLSALVHVTVTNVPPTVTLLSPAEGAVIPVPANVTIQAEAADIDGTVAKVQFYGDGKLLETLTSSPYTFVWKNVPPGKHEVKVRALDGFGGAASASAHFTVSDAPPTVALVQPVGGARFTAHTNISLEAQASDSDGTVASVSFWANGRYLGVVTKTPFVLTWKDVSAGSYILKAIATDEFGAKTVSQPVAIVVSK